MRVCGSLQLSLLVLGGCGGSVGQATSDAGTTPDAIVSGDAGVAPRDAGAPDAAIAEASRGVDAGSPEAAPPFMTAPHAALPQLPNQGGPILAHVKLVTVTFQNDPHEASIESFGTDVVTSHWLTTVGADYGVGAGTHEHVTLAETAPPMLSGADIGPFLETKLMDGTLPGRSTQPSEYLYMIYYPPGTVITDLVGGCQSSADRGSSAWHDSVTDANASFAYAVIPTCSLQAVSDIEYGASHELIEAATDTYPLSRPAFQMPSSSSWYNIMAEVGDLCEFLPGITEGGHTYTPAWSNSAAAAGVQPCIPGQASPFFDVSVSPDAVHSVSPGQTLTFPVVGWSTAPTPAWTVGVSSTTFVPYGGPLATAQVDNPTISNGDTRTLTVTVPATATSQWTGVVLLDSETGPYKWASAWPVVLQVP